MIDPVELKRLSSLPVSIAILDRTGTITEVNEQWVQAARRRGLEIADAGVGSDYLSACHPGVSEKDSFRQELRNLLRGTLGLITYAYTCFTGEPHHWCVLIGFPLTTQAGQVCGGAMLHIDISNLIRSGPVVRNYVGSARQRGADAAASAAETQLTPVLEHMLERMLGALLERFEAQGGVTSSSGITEDEYENVRTALTPSQFAVFRLLAEGQTNEEIAETLRVSPQTVRLHVSAILRRLELPNRGRAIAHASQLMLRYRSARKGTSADPIN